MKTVKIKSAEQQGDILHVVVDIPDVAEDFSIYMHIDALGSRMVTYELKTPEEAMQAIMREHFARLSDDHKTPLTKENAIKQMLNELQVVQVEGMAKVRPHLKKNVRRIAQAKALRTPE